MNQLLECKCSNSHSHFENYNERLLKCKCSQGHVEMIISFVIFVGFIGTLLFILNPLQTKQINYTILDITEEALMKEWSINYETVSVSLSDSQIVCFSVPNSLNLRGNLVAKDDSGRKVDAFLSSGININPVLPSRFFKLYASESFDSAERDTACQRVSEETTYSFGALNEKSAVLYENIESFVLEYNSDYEGLRDRLGLQNDFALYVYEQYKSVPILNATISAPKVTEVIARNTPIVAITKNAEQKNLVINLRAW